MNIATKEQLIIATGYRQKSKQIDWLKKRFKPFEINHFGNPVVAVEILFNLPLPKSQTVNDSKWKTKIQD